MTALDVVRQVQAAGGHFVRVDPNDGTIVVQRITPELQQLVAENYGAVRAVVEEWVVVHGSSSDAVAKAEALLRCSR
jgi:hypothetical protein